MISTAYCQYVTYKLNCKTSPSLPLPHRGPAKICPCSRASFMYASAALQVQLCLFPWPMLRRCFPATHLQVSFLGGCANEACVCDEVWLLGFQKKSMDFILITYDFISFHLSSSFIIFHHLSSSFTLINMALSLLPLVSSPASRARSSHLWAALRLPTRPAAAIRALKA